LSPVLKIYSNHWTDNNNSTLDKKAGKFKEWLDYFNLTDLKPNTPVMEVFSYLAYETVGQVRILP
jgi:glutamine cyclotransferase